MKIRLINFMHLTSYDTLVTVYNNHEKCIFSGSAETYFSEEEYSKYNDMRITHIDNNENGIEIFVK